MRKITPYISGFIYAVLFCIIAFNAANAGTPSTGAGSSSNSNTATNSEQGQAQNSEAVSQTSNNIDYSQHSNSTAQATDLSRAVAYAPGLNGQIGFSVCAKHVGMSVGVAGFGGGIQIPLSDEPCNERADLVAYSEKLARMGDVATAREVLCGSVRVLRASVRASKPCWLESEDLLEELSYDERDFYATMMADLAVAKMEKQDAIQTELDRVNGIIQRMDQLEQDTNNRLNHYQRLSVMK